MEDFFNCNSNQDEDEDEISEEELERLAAESRAKFLANREKIKEYFCGDGTNSVKSDEERNKQAKMLSGLISTDTKNSMLNKVKSLDIDELVPFDVNPFKCHEIEKLQELADSIKQDGLISPIVVREIAKDKYQILAGHNRVEACRLAEIYEVDAVVLKDCDDEKAITIMTDSNLLQREKIYPSEKAFAYKMKLDAMKRQAGRPAKNNSAQLGRNYEGKESREILAEQSGESRNQIQRYIRLTKLNKELLDKVDNESLGFTTGVELSYLTAEEQAWLDGIMLENDGIKVSLEQALVLKGLSKEDSLSMVVMEDTLGLLKKEKVKEYDPYVAAAKRLNTMLKKISKKSAFVANQEEVENEIVEEVEKTINNVLAKYNLTK